MRQPSNTFFKPVPEGLRKSQSILVRLSQTEADTIRESAKIRNLTVAEFVRRAALGKKADVRYETEIVLQLIDAVRAIRQIHKGMVDKGMTPPEALLLPVLEAAEDAIFRVSQ